MERKTRIKVAAVALTAVFLASVALASLAFGASSNAAGTGTYQTFAISKNSPGMQDMTSSWTSVVSISMPYVGIEGWYKVECDGYAALRGTELEIAIGVNSMSPDFSTYRFYGIPAISETVYSGTRTEEMYYLPAGAHTFHFLERKYAGTGTLCRVAYLKITVTFFTDAYVEQVGGAEVGGDAVMG